MRRCSANVMVCTDAGAAALEVAERIACAAARAVAERGTFCIAIPGGSSPRATFELLATPEFANRIPWDKTQVFFTDERCVPPYHEDSNYKLASDLLLSKVPIPQENVHRFKTELPPTAAAADYEDQLRLALGKQPRLDFVLLGMGADTHTASLFPHSPALRETTRLAIANHVSQLGSHRLTLTLPVLNSAREIVILALGPDKADAVREALRGELDTDAHPVQAIRPSLGRLVWIIDDQALNMVG